LEKRPWRYNLRIGSKREWKPLEVEGIKPKYLRERRLRPNQYYGKWATDYVECGYATYHSETIGNGRHITTRLRALDSDTSMVKHPGQEPLCHLDPGTRYRKDLSTGQGQTYFRRRLTCWGEIPGHQ